MTALRPTFLPSRHGFAFTNRFPVPARLAPLVQRLAGQATYGLCGGMAQGAADAFRAGLPLPGDTVPPAWGTPLHLTLLRRQFDTMGGVTLRHVWTFAAWTRASDAEGQRRTQAAWPEIRRHLAAGNLVLLGLVYTDRLVRLWENHQVLAYALGDDLSARVYDPNYPRRDDVRLAFVPTPDGLHVEQWVGRERGRVVRGAFRIPLDAQAATRSAAARAGDGVRPATLSISRTNAAGASRTHARNAASGG